MCSAAGLSPISSDLFSDSDQEVVIIASEEDGDTMLDLGHMQPEPNTEDNDATLDLGYEQPERESVEQDRASERSDLGGNIAEGATGVAVAQLGLKPEFPLLFGEGASPEVRFCWVLHN